MNTNFLWARINATARASLLRSTADVVRQRTRPRQTSCRTPSAEHSVRYSAHVPNVAAAIYGRGGGLGRGLAVGPPRGVIVGLGVAVGVAVAVGFGDGVDVGVAVGVTVAPGVGVGVDPACTSKEPLSMRLFTTRVKPGPR